MKLSALKEQARKILEIPEQIGTLELVQFTTNSGGCPDNRVGVVITNKTQTFRYNTTANGPAYAGCAEVMCELTDTTDRNGDEIYRDSEGTMFVYRYRSGSPESFDYGAFVTPVLT